EPRPCGRSPQPHAAERFFAGAERAGPQPLSARPGRPAPPRGDARGRCRGGGAAEVDAWRGVVGILVALAAPASSPPLAGERQRGGSRLLSPYGFPFPTLPR